MSEFVSLTILASLSHLARAAETGEGACDPLRDAHDERDHATASGIPTPPATPAARRIAAAPRA